MEARRLILARLRHLSPPAGLLSKPPSVPQTEGVLGFVIPMRSFSSEASSSSSSSWFQRLKKGLFGNQETAPSSDQEVASRSSPGAERMDDLNLESE
jgi:hypothetical protein